MASSYKLPLPPSLDIHDAQAADKWKKFKLVWTHYSLATVLNKKPEAVQVATLLTVMDEKARDIIQVYRMDQTGRQQEDGASAGENFPVLQATQECTVQKVPF